MTAKERTRMFRELNLIRCGLILLRCKLFEGNYPFLWRIVLPEGLVLWLEFERESWSLRPLGSEHKYPEIWRTVLSAIDIANKHPNVVLEVVDAQENIKEVIKHEG